MPGGVLVGGVLVLSRASQRNSDERLGITTGHVHQSSLKHPSNLF